MEQTNKQAALAAIDRYADRICRLSDAIWDFAELSLQERSLRRALLHRAGTAGLCGGAGRGRHRHRVLCPRWGSGKPVIGILAEYDALERAVPAGRRHRTCAPHPGRLRPRLRPHLLGAGGMAAAVAIKEYLQATGRPGTVEFYRGCPRRGRRRQGFHGPGQRLAQPGRGPDLASGHGERGGHRVHQLLHPDPVFSSTGWPPTRRASRNGAAAPWTRWSS